jgi:thymidylate synthase ThyX
MFPYAEESFTPEEADVLRRYVTNLDGPVFALVNLPEVVKGALFARYSRSAKSLRRLLLDEFVPDLDISGDAGIDATVGLRRAEELYARVFGEYGDDSVAQLGGVHLACEQASNLLTKLLERGRLMAYLEQSTRYVGYDSRLPSGHFRYYRDPDVLDSPLGARYVGDMDRMFDTYASLLPEMQAWVSRRFPQQPGDSDFVHRQAVRAKALDALRGLLPSGALSNVGVYGSGQAYEQLLLRMRAHRLPEARRYAELILTELQKVIPSFLSRLDRPDRGGVWRDYLAERREATDTAVAELVGAEDDPLLGGAPAWSAEDLRPSEVATPDVTLTDWDPDGETKVLVAIVHAHSRLPEATCARRVAALGADDRLTLLRAYVGERTNRRHRPGRAFERTDYRFEVVSDYGAFRDLQRHRMLTVDWQALDPGLGWTVPGEIDEAGLGPAFRRSLERSAVLYDAMVDRFPEQAVYAVAFAYRLRYTMQMNAREAMHVLELRSGPQGHPSYRAVAQEMHRCIAEQAGHRLLAQAMSFVDHTSPELERLDAERRAEQRRAATAEAP